MNATTAKPSPTARILKAARMSLRPRTLDDVRFSWRSIAHWSTGQWRFCHVTNKPPSCISRSLERTSRSRCQRTECVSFFKIFTREGAGKTRTFAWTAEISQEYKRSVFDKFGHKDILRMWAVGGGSGGLGSPGPKNNELSIASHSCRVRNKRSKKWCHSG